MITVEQQTFGLLLKYWNAQVLCAGKICTIDLICRPRIVNLRVTGTGHLIQPDLKDCRLILKGIDDISDEDGAELVRIVINAAPVTDETKAQLGKAFTAMWKSLQPPAIPLVAGDFLRDRCYDADGLIGRGLAVDVKTLEL